MKRKVALFLSLIIGTASVFSTGAVATEAATTIDTDAVLSGKDSSTYEEYLNNYTNKEKVFTDIVVEINKKLSSENTLEFSVEIPTEGLYTLGMTYKVIDESMKNYFEIGCKVDDNYPYPEAESISFPKWWKDVSTEHRTDINNNEFASEQVIYDGYYFSDAIDIYSDYGTKFAFFLSAGTHNVTISSKEENIDIKSFGFYGVDDLKEYSENSTYKNYKGENIVLEGESAIIKSNYSIVGKTDSSTTAITPHDPRRNVINYIGGGSWKTIGEEIVWETPELEEGYYNLGFVFRQNSIIGGKVYRSLKIDGVTPFAEAEKIGFSYADNWQNQVFGKEDEPYKIYLSEGKHILSLQVTAGDIAIVRDNLKSAINKLSDLYIDMTMITGENVDIYRDYDLFNQISDMENRVEEIKDLLITSGENLKTITGERTGSYYSVINNMVEILNQMLKNKFNAHRYIKSYYSNYCSVSSVLQELRSMPLDIDKIILASPENEKIFAKSGLFDKISFSFQRFISSFTRDYSGISSSDSKDSITIWVNWGRDQAQVLSSMIDSSFTPGSNINVNLQLVNASIIQATLSGLGPDCILQHTRSEPVNLAMRNVLYDLSTFEDCDEVLERFQEGAELPYRYKDGLYALPDTQTFFAMFYRKDIFEKFGLSVPTTWEEFKEVSKLLMRRNMSVWLPNTPATNVAQTNVGVGAINIFPSLLMQNGLSLYSEDGKKTNLLSAESMEVFGTWTDYYRKMKFPVTLDFYNRFRTGTTPLGISSYTLYTTLKVAASEIDGLWGVTPIPGTVREDGTIDHTSSGGGTGCAILKISKNPEAAWEFLKWWTDTETQLIFSNNIESILGAAGRIAVSNVESFKGLSWNEGMLEQLLKAWDNVQEVPEYPGSYYISRSIYQSFWNVVNDNQNTKDMLMKYGKEADDEIDRKWKQYTNR